jgi:hypothetical protein
MPRPTRCPFRRPRNESERGENIVQGADGIMAVMAQHPNLLENGHGVENRTSAPYCGQLERMCEQEAMKRRRSRAGADGTASETSQNDHGVENRAKGSLVAGRGPQADNVKILNKHDAQLSRMNTLTVTPNHARGLSSAGRGRS